ncbi:hypothetical protein EYF80_009638 [Liparis tanakae]|uniref:Uncharacterized protein n=1 Tax=Liparis tanakae TaxID=230148 RepID=A0A4Z2IQS1_9TELE|nr:hypothetical protein EYF80_009638 [Liparis tanakae]
MGVSFIPTRQDIEGTRRSVRVVLGTWNGHAPPYLQELITPQTSTHTSQIYKQVSSSSPNTKLRTMGDRAFCSAAPPCGTVSLPT